MDVILIGFYNNSLGLFIPGMLTLDFMLAEVRVCAVSYTHLYIPIHFSVTEHKKKTIPHILIRIFLAISVTNLLTFFSYKVAYIFHY